MILERDEYIGDFRRRTKAAEGDDITQEDVTKETQQRVSWLSWTRDLRIDLGVCFPELQLLRLLVASIYVPQTHKSVDHNEATLRDCMIVAAKVKQVVTISRRESVYLGLWTFRTTWKSPLWT